MSTKSVMMGLGVRLRMMVAITSKSTVVDSIRTTEMPKAKSTVVLIIRK